MKIKLGAKEINGSCFESISSFFKQMAENDSEAGHIYRLLDKKGREIMVANIPYGIIWLQDGYSVIAESCNPEIDGQKLANYVNKNAYNRH